MSTDSVSTKIIDKKVYLLENYNKYCDKVITKDTGKHGSDKRPPRNTFLLCEEHYNSSSDPKNGETTNMDGVKVVSSIQ